MQRQLQNTAPCQKHSIVWVSAGVGEERDETQMENEL